MQVLFGSTLQAAITRLASLSSSPRAECGTLLHREAFGIYRACLVHPHRQPGTASLHRPSKQLSPAPFLTMTSGRMADTSQASGSKWLPVAATVLFGGAVAAATFAATRYAYQQELERRYGAADGSRHRHVLPVILCHSKHAFHLQLLFCYDLCTSCVTKRNA